MDDKLPNGIQLVLVVNGKNTTGRFLPLSETYALTEQGLQTLFYDIRDVLARLYEERSAQRVSELEQEIARLSAQQTEPKQP